MSNIIVRLNSKMKKIDFINSDSEIDYVLIKELNDILYHIKTIKECVIYDTENTEEKDINFERIFKYVDDLTGYEVGCNEFKFKRNANNSFSKVAEFFLLELIKKFPDCKFVVYILVEEKDFFLRFHKLRESEGIWLNDNLEEYDNAVLYAMN